MLTLFVGRKFPDKKIVVSLVSNRIKSCGNRFCFHLDQHRLKQSDLKNLQDSPEYGDAVNRVNEALLTYNSTNDKHNFVDVYKESDYTVDGITYCVFNDLILRSIQNITEAYFVVDSTEQSISEDRLSELQVTIVERYKREWTRQNEIEQQLEQEVMEELAGELA